MVKHKVPAGVHPRPSHSVRALADRYFCEQCDRLGLPRPHPIAPIKPLKAPKHPFRPREVDPALVAKDREDGLAIEAMLANEKAPKMGLDAILRAYSDVEDR